MCIWKNDYYGGCSHQPFYLQDICSRRTISIDAFTNKRIIQACNRLDISAVLTIEDICPECHLTRSITRAALQPRPPQMQPVALSHPIRTHSNCPSLYEPHERPTIRPGHAETSLPATHASYSSLAFGQWPVLTSSRFTAAYNEMHHLTALVSSPVPSSPHYVETPPPPPPPHHQHQNQHQHLNQHQHQNHQHQHQNHQHHQHQQNQQNHRRHHSLAQSLEDGYLLQLPPVNAVNAVNGVNGVNSGNGRNGMGDFYTRRRPAGRRPERPEHTPHSSYSSVRSHESHDFLRRGNGGNGGNAGARSQRRHAIDGFRMEPERRGALKIDEGRATAAAIEGASPRRRAKLSSIVGVVGDAGGAELREIVDGGNREAVY